MKHHDRMSNTRNRRKARQNTNGQVESWSVQPQSQANQAEKPDKSSPKVSPRDIVNCSFETNESTIQTAPGRSRVSGGPLGNKKRLLNTANQATDGKQAKRPKLISQPVLNPTFSKSGLVLWSGDHITRTRETKDVQGNREPSKQHPKALKAPEALSSDADEKTPETRRSTAKTMKEEPSQKVLAVAAPVPASIQTPSILGNICDIASQIVPAPQQEVDKTARVSQQNNNNGPSSSSSTSKGTSNSRRVSFEFLRRTRPQRRAIAKARTARQKFVGEKEQEKEKISKLEEMGDDERERTIKMIEKEKKEREAVKRREVQRVKNRESVAKSRVKELVIEAKVETEGDALRWENQRLAGFLECWKRSNVMRDLKNETANFIKKREVAEQEDQVLEVDDMDRVP